MILVRRAVFDTSTLVSAALRPSSIPERALLLTLEHATVCVCDFALDELGSVPGRDKFDRYLTRSARQEFVSLLRRNALSIQLRQNDIDTVEPSCRDRRDNLFLALAEAAAADVIVGSDEDLLVHHSWRGIPIVSLFQSRNEPEGLVRGGQRGRLLLGMIS